MTEREVKFTNLVKAVCAPFIYNFIMMFVQVVMDVVLFYRQGRNMNGYANFASSYTFMDTINQNIEKYSYVITFISALIAIVVFGIAYRNETEGIKKGSFIMQLKYNDYKMCGVLTALGVFISLGLSHFVSLLPLDNVIGNYQETSNKLMGGSLGMQILSLGIIVPIAEELIYRGLVYNELKKNMEPLYAMVLAAIIFGVFHFNLLQGTYAFILGIILICAYVKCNTIIAPIIIHSLANLTSVIASQTGASAFFSSNMFVYIVAMTVELIVAFVLFEMMVNWGEDTKAEKKK